MNPWRGAGAHLSVPSSPGCGGYSQGPTWPPREERTSKAAAEEVAGRSSLQLILAGASRRVPGPLIGCSRLTLDCDWSRELSELGHCLCSSYRRSKLLGS